MKKVQKREMKLYECLGVKQFQWLVFQLEKVIHFKDKGKNINYHIQNRSVDELRGFQKYLYFNGFIHVRNSIVVSGLLVLQQLFFSNWALLYLIPSLMKNLYCVMLQRYNYLRIHRVIEVKEKQMDRKIDRKKEEFVEEKKEELTKVKNKEVCLQNIENLRQFLRGESDAVLDQSSVETLHLLRDLIHTDPSVSKQNTNQKQNEVYMKQ